jgi:hypothetical protein
MRRGTSRLYCSKMLCWFCYMAQRGDGELAFSSGNGLDGLDLL